MKTKIRASGKKGLVHSVCIGEAKGMPKRPVEEATLVEGLGVSGDIHQGPGDRQVSIIALEDVVALREKGIVAAPGDFAENIMISGLGNIGEIQPGCRLKIGKSILEITEIGKKEWKEGDYSFQGYPLVARKGIFARVAVGGKIKPGDTVELYQKARSKSERSRRNKNI